MSAKDNRNMKKNGISVRTIQALITIITLVISAALLFATYRMASDYSDLKSETNQFIQLTESSSELMNASDYLTEQVRLFAETGNREYMDNYFKEANEYKRREKALEKLNEIAGEGPAYNALKAALNESVNLMNREYYSMRLTSDSYGLKKADLPEAVQISMGVAYGEGKTGEELFRAADDALYEVKSSGKGGYIISDK